VNFLIYIYLYLLCSVPAVMVAMWLGRYSHIYDKDSNADNVSGSNGKSAVIKFPSAVTSGVPRGGGLRGSNPPHKIPKALQNRAKLNLIVKTVTYC